MSANRVKKDNHDCKGHNPPEILARVFRDHTPYFLRAAAKLEPPYPLQKVALLTLFRRLSPDILYPSRPLAACY
jgi:hypothetical protein